MTSIVGVARARYDRAVHLLRRGSLPALRIALGVVFVWFGALKVSGSTPVAELVLDTVPFIDPPAWIVPATGVFEVGVGLWLMTGIGLRLLLPVYAAHMLATFGVLVVQPELSFLNGNPLLLTAEGEFVVKNLVLLAAGIAVCTRSRGRAAGGTDSGTRDSHALAA